MAIAVVDTGDGFNGSGTSATAALDVSGTDPCVVAAIWCWNAADTYVNTTYAGTAMTELHSRTLDSGTGRIVGLKNPSTGTNNVQSNTSGNMQHWISCASYSGVDQTTPFPDTETDGTTTGSSATPNMTTSVTDSWVFCHARTPSKDMSAGTDTFERVQNPVSADSANLFDSNAARASGSNNLQYTWTGSTTTYWIMGSIAPSASASGPANLKSLDTNLKANIKSWNTNLIANIKSINTNV
jgi:hypothetical protein